MKEDILYEKGVLSEKNITFYSYLSIFYLYFCLEAIIIDIYNKNISLFFQTYVYISALQLSMSVLHNFMSFLHVSLSVLRIFNALCTNLYVSFAHLYLCCSNLCLFCIS